ncbi:MAG: hypothetical protein HFJ95_06560 [Muribaculaceae bacterium]|nr:hypothetical protein [Muribaculaceae bacterium]
MATNQNLLKQFGRTIQTLRKELLIQYAINLYGTTATFPDVRECGGGYNGK